MKISASLPDSDVAFLDEYAREHQETRSGALQQAVTLLRHRDLGDQYEAAWAADNAQEWDVVAGDGLTGR